MVDKSPEDLRYDIAMSAAQEAQEHAADASRHARVALLLAVVAIVGTVACGLLMR